MRDWHGVTPAYRRGDVTASSLFEFSGALDRDGVRAAWGELDDPFATVLAGVRRERCAAIVGTGCAGVAEHHGDRVETSGAAGARGVAESRGESIGGDWVAAFEAAVAQLATVREPIVALGGGVDAAAVLVAWRASGAPMPRVATLATGIAEYDEVTEAQAIARALDVACEVIRVTPAALVALAPEAAVLAETPLYNLHPVHRLALARAVRGTLITGDGADACFRGVPDLDYVPIVAALTVAGTGHATQSPFFAPSVIAATPHDPRKRVLRDYVRSAIGALADRPKQSRLVPPLPLPFELPRIERLARELALPPRLDRDHRRVGWYTLEALARRLT